MKNKPSSIETEEPEYSGLSFTKTLIIVSSITVAGLVIITLLNEFKPEARKLDPTPNIVSVKAAKPLIKDYPIIISSNGSTSATTRSKLIAQVSGEITDITDQFANGADFKKGDLLLSIDKRNYMASVSSAKANLSQAQASFEAEQANAAQAQKDWTRLGYSGQPNDRVLRKPQLNAAKAQLSAAKAALSKAQLDYSRTQIKAPYNGSVISKAVGVGQFVSIGSQLGEIFSNEGLEVQLPLNQEQYAQLDMTPQSTSQLTTKSKPASQSTIKPKVTLFAELAGITHEWSAHIIRTDKAFDTTTRQLNATARIDNTISNNGLELKIGQYVNASIQGRIVPQATIIPNSAIREGRYIFILENDVLRRKDVNIVWQDNSNTIIENISPDSLVVSTSLSGAVSGTKAKLVGQATFQKDSQKNIQRQNNITNDPNK